MLKKNGLIISSLVYLTASMLLAIGLIVMAGWVFKIAAVVQVFPNLVPMQFNTALCFFVSGVALLSLYHDKRFTNFILFLILLSIAVPTLMEYCLTRNLGIDNLFIEPFISTSTPYPGRMALITAICFTFFASYIFLIRIIRTKLWYIAGMFPTVIGVLGTISLLGYLFDIKQAYSLSSVTYMALHTSIGFIILAIGSFLILFKVFNLNFYQKQTILESSVFFFSSLLVFAVWLAIRASIVDHIKEETSRRLEILESQIIVEIEGEALALSRLFTRFEVGTYSSIDTLKQDVNHYLKDMTSLVSVNFGSGFNNNTQYYLNTHYNSSFAKALNARCKTVINSTFNYDDIKGYRIADKGHDFFCFYKGSSMAIIDLSEILQSFAKEKDAKYHFQILSAGHVNKTRNTDLKKNEFLDTFQVERTINIFGNKYLIQGYPDKRHVEQALSRFPSYIVLVSIVFAVLFLIINRNRRLLRNKDAQLKSYEILNYTLLSSVGESIIGIDKNSQIHFMNDSAQILLDYQLNAGNQVDIEDVLKSNTLNNEDSILELVEQSIKYSVTVKKSRINLVLGNGKVLPVLFSSSPIMENGITVGAIIVLFDISERILYEEELQKIAHYDSLTNLPNRYSIMNQIESSIARANREAVGFALCFIDINSFKMINDTYGHNVGDKSLKFLGNKIQDNIRKNDFSGRLSGDEFCIILEGVSEGKQVDAVISKLKSSLRQPFYVNNVEIPIDISVGYVFYVKGMTAEALLTVADHEMYKNKRSSGTSSFLSKI